jgi:hypothetical protein
MQPKTAQSRLDELRTDVNCIGAAAGFYATVDGGLGSHVAGKPVSSVASFVIEKVQSEGIAVTPRALVDLAVECLENAVAVIGYDAVPTGWTTTRVPRPCRRGWPD